MVFFFQKVQQACRRRRSEIELPLRTFLYSILCVRWKNLAAYESWDALQLTPVTLSAERKQLKDWKTLIKFTFAGFGPFQTFSPLIST